MKNTILELKDIVKAFPGVLALNRLKFDLKSGEVHAICGENGAGKSTLMKVVCGVHKPDQGEMYVNGVPRVFSSPLEAYRNGVSIIFQETSLFEEMSVLDNMFLGHEIMKKRAGLKMIDYAAMRKKANEIFAKLNTKMDLNACIKSLGIAQKQMVEIAKALTFDANIIIFDEPTAVLTPQEIDELMEIMRGFAKEGKSILFITHKLNEILAVADRCTVLRKGKYVGTVDVKNTTKEELSKMMVGRELEFNLKKADVKAKETVLSVRNVSVMSEIHKKTLAVKNVSFDVRAGEIVCLAGIDGNGQTELIYALTGLQKMHSGQITLCGKDITKASIRERSKAGMSHIPEDRHKHGLILDYTLEENIVLQRYWQPKFQRLGFIKKKEVRDYANRLIEQYDVRSGQGPITVVRSMSGGNQQKAIIAREIDKEHKLLVAVQPTRGLDVGAIEYIHKQLISSRDAGKAVLLVSFELDEVMNISDRILVMYEGEIVGELDPKKTSVQELGLYMSGAKRDTVTVKEKNYV